MTTISTTTFAVHTIAASPDNGPLGIAYDPARSEVFVAWNYSATISVISDASTGGVVATIPLGLRVRGRVRQLDARHGLRR